MMEMPDCVFPSCFSVLNPHTQNKNMLKILFNKSADYTTIQVSLNGHHISVAKIQ